ncbi:MFS transporter [Ramlibacter sp.]|uniref:MFS transporter n=1 Tax=Ramlibacter sp. TaxID=1917967 RepID=UPI0025ED8069|nr:MFS transporter [Ramlibacter sp.]
MHHATGADAATPKLGRGLTAVFAVSVGVAVLSLYASQPLIGPIGVAFGWNPSEAGLATTLTLLGYASGLFLLVPLVDLVENRSLIVGTLAIDVVALAVLARAPTPSLFLAACYATGVAASVIQMLVPVAVRLAPEPRRGQVVGNVMSGLMLGILLSRPAASLAVELGGWRWFYGWLSAAVAVLTVVLSFAIPRYQPRCAQSYWKLIGSMATILRQEPVLRRRAAYQALCMGTFGAFWTSISLRLSTAPFDLGPKGIALFALAGAAGAVVAPVAGRAGDRGWTQGATRVAHLAVTGAVALAWIGGHVLARGSSAASAGMALAALALSAVLLDLGVIADQTLGRRAVNLLQPQARGRVNGLFTGLFFLGAAAGSGASGFAWMHWGWPGVCGVALAFAGTALAISLMAQPR